MTIHNGSAGRTRNVLEAYYALFGAPQLQLTDNEVADHMWVQWAACGDAEPELFFALSPTHPNVEEAQEYCAACPVRIYCRDHADQAGEVGVWGGIYRRMKDKRPARVCKRDGCIRYAREHRAYCSDQCDLVDSVGTADREAVMAA